MRVMIDALPLLVRSAGVKNYLYYWIQSLRRAARTEIQTFPAIDTGMPLTHEASMAGPWHTQAALGAMALANYTRLPIFDWIARGSDIFHASNLLRKPPSRKGARPRLTATIHDLTCWIMPEVHSAANLRADREFGEALRRADGLIAVSQSTKEDAVRILKIAPEKMTVIHSGIAPAFFKIDGRAIQETRQRYSLKRPSVLFVGTIEPRKNLDFLITAFESLPGSLKQQFELVVAGPIGWAERATVERLRGLRYLGYVPENDIPALTAGATVFAYPSLYEGFGFPVAQAMAAGVPVITSNVSALPEIAGDAALLIDPRSLDGLRSALERLLLSESLRNELAARGRERARAFSWERCAQESLKWFRQIAGSRG